MDECYNAGSGCFDKNYDEGNEAGWLCEEVVGIGRAAFNAYCAHPKSYRHHGYEFYSYDGSMFGVLSAVQEFQAREGER